jgi:D-3-phosphoglycerate dehydrogenase
MGPIVWQTFGLVGCGNTGRAVAKKASCLGVEIIGNEPYPGRRPMPDASVNLVSLAELLEKSDYVSLHTPLVRETHHVI